MVQQNSRISVRVDTRFDLGFRLGQPGQAQQRGSAPARHQSPRRRFDPDTGAELPAGHHGLLEAQVAPISPDWIRTTDIASIDSDGSVTLHGRADGAINRGGFKILPETVRRVLISHPAVRDACVVGGPTRGSGRCRSPPSRSTPEFPRRPMTI
jgi:acyl-CoA synthetase (AMP-forming)/AMP-acid ligase II